MTSAGASAGVASAAAAAAMMVAICIARSCCWRVLIIERVQKGIAYWDKQNNDVPAPNCMLKV